MANYVNPDTWDQDADGDYLDGGKDYLANADLNYWSFDTNVAATYLNEETGQDYSVNIGYIYNTENSDTDYQTGQELQALKRRIRGVRYGVP